MLIRVLSSAASSHDPTFLKSVVIHSSNDVSDIYPWHFPPHNFPFFKVIVLLSIQPVLGRPYNWSGPFGEKKNVLPLPGVKVGFFDFQAHWLITTLTKQSWPLYSGKLENIKHPKFSIQTTPFGTCHYSDEVKYLCVFQRPYKIIPWCCVLDCIF